MSSTRRATLGPEYRLLNVWDLRLASSTVWFSNFFRVAWVGRSLLVCTSPWKSGGMVSSSLRFVGFTERSPVGAVAPFVPFVLPAGAAVEAAVLVVAAVGVVAWVAAVGDDVVSVVGLTVVSNGVGAAALVVAVFSDGWEVGCAVCCSAVVLGSILVASIVAALGSSAPAVSFACGSVVEDMLTTYSRVVGRQSRNTISV